MSLYLERVVGCLVAVRGRVVVLEVVPGLRLIQQTNKVYTPGNIIF